MTIRREVNYAMDVGSYVLRITRCHDDPDMLRFALSWNDNGREQHEGFVPADLFVEALLAITGDEDEDS
jgi:hypothetical protein